MRSSRRSCQKCRNRRWKDDKGQDPVALVAGLHGRSSSNYRHMAFCSGSFAHRSYFDLFCRSVVLSGKKAVIKLHLPKASERMECFHGKMYLENQSAWPVFGGAGVLRWENLFTGEKERSLFPFPWEERKNRSSGLRPEAAGAAVSDFVFLTGNARIFFVSFL